MDTPHESLAFENHDSPEELHKKVLHEQFLVLDGNVRRALSLLVITVPLFGIALAQQGSITGFGWWAVGVLLFVPVLFVLPIITAVHPIGLCISACRRQAGSSQQHQQCNCDQYVFHI